MIYLSTGQVILLHQKLIAETGGMQGLRDEGALSSAINNAFSTFDSKELYPTLIDKASITCFCLVSNHPFNDGNKRLGLFTLLIMLEINGVILDYSQEELIALGQGIAEGKIQSKHIHNWINEHIQTNISE